METETEETILQAAQEEFENHGFTGARMQRIAEAADINKAMLHYYFRNKDRLFFEVYRRAAKKLFPIIHEVFESDLNFRDKIYRFVDTYISLLKKNPHLPTFVMMEMNRNPKRLESFVSENFSHVPAKFQKQIREEMESGRIRKMDPRQLIVNLISMSIMPFIGHAMIKAILQFDDEQFDDFLEARRTEVPNFILNALEP